MAHCVLRRLKEQNRYVASLSCRQRIQKQSVFIVIKVINMANIERILTPMRKNGPWWAPSGLEIGSSMEPTRDDRPDFTVRVQAITA